MVAPVSKVGSESTGLSPSEMMSQSQFRQELTEAIPHMRAFARSLTGEAASADDLAQDAMMKAWSARDKFKAGRLAEHAIDLIGRDRSERARRGHDRQPAQGQEAHEHARLGHG